MITLRLVDKTRFSFVNREKMKLHKQLITFDVM